MTTVTTLTDRHVVIYGAGGTLGTAIGMHMANAGAIVHVTGPHMASLRTAAAKIGAAAHVAIVDAYDETAVTNHLDSLERVDVSINLALRGDVQGIPLVDMSINDLMAPIVSGTRSQFFTARAAAKRMTAQHAGVIIAVNSGSAEGSPMMGGTGLADGAIDALIRNLAMECGPAGVRACGMWIAGVPESLTLERLTSVNARVTADRSTASSPASIRCE